MQKEGFRVQSDPEKSRSEVNVGLLKDIFRDTLNEQIDLIDNVAAYGS